MRTQPSRTGGTERSQRDALEECQQALREARERGARLVEGNAALSAEVAQLEQEVRGLRRGAHAGGALAERSLPQVLQPPFHVRPSRRTLYGRWRFALATWPRRDVLIPLLWLGATSRTGWLVLFAVYVLSGLLLRMVLQGPEDDAEPGWSFGEEAFAACTATQHTGRTQVRYAEVLGVEVRRGLLARLFGFGAVRITWRPSQAPQADGKVGGQKPRRVSVTRLDDPEQLVRWLRARCHLPEEGTRGG